MNRKTGKTDSGFPWTCIMDQHGFHFSIQNGIDVLCEFVDVTQMSRDQFYDTINTLEKELCEIELFGGIKMIEEKSRSENSPTSVTPSETILDASENAPVPEPVAPVQCAETPEEDMECPP
jgi:hypothetical protein